MNRDDPSLMLAALRRQMNQRRLIDGNIHNLTRSIFKPGLKVQYRVGARDDFFGVVVEVAGAPGMTHVLVENINKPKARKRKFLNLADIIGFVQET